MGSVILYREEQYKNVLLYEFSKLNYEVRVYHAVSDKKFLYHRGD